jgi:hypothetical protein
LWAFLVSPIHRTCHAHLILIDLFILINSGEEDYLWNFSSYNVLEPPPTPSDLSQNSFLSTMFSNIPNECFFFMWETNIQIHSRLYVYVCLCKHQIKMCLRQAFSICIYSLEVTFIVILTYLTELHLVCFMFWSLIIEETLHKTDRINY